jgi:hypothetical protein
MRARLATLAVIALASLLLAAAARVQAAREAIYPAHEIDDGSLYLSGPAVRRLTGGFNALTADVYWIRAILHYGGTKRRLAAQPTAAAPRDYALLYPLLDITTTLDPRFKIAYRFGSVFLAEAFPSGSGRPDLAIQLLEKGARAQPERWEYLQDIGFVHYWYRHDYRAAAEWFGRAANTPGAPWWLRSLAASTAAVGGDRRSSRVMWEAIRQSADNDWLRQDAERRLRQLQALDVIDQLQPRVDEFAHRAGRPPADWAAVVRAGLLRGIPLDPVGTPYELAPGGRVRLSERSPLFPLPVEPEPLASAPS